jgi:Flp pilus assembly protein CpaB
MATTPTRPKPAAPSSNGHGKAPAVTISPPGRRTRGPEVIVGLVVIIVFALGAVLLHLSAVDRTPALAVVGSVERGDTITAADVKVIYVSSDDALARLPGSQLTQVVGQVALVDLAPGTLLSRSVVADRPSLDPGEGVVGLPLEPGGYPSLGLAPGDRVSVIRTAEPAAVDGDGESAEVVLTRDATVFSVEELASDRRLVSIVAPEGDAEAVAAASGSGSLRLVLVSP